MKNRSALRLASVCAGLGLAVCIVVSAQTNAPDSAPASTPAVPASVNLLPNGSFERVEPPPPSAESVKSGSPLAPEDMLPQTWDYWQQSGPVRVLCPADAATAHSGIRCVHMDAARGQAFLRYGPLPIAASCPWTVRFWARGTGTVIAAAMEFLPDKRTRLKDWTFPLTASWEPYELRFDPPAGVRTWHLDLGNSGPADVWLDDVFVGYPGLQPLGLPPTNALGKDAHTLLYLPFEEPLDEYQFFVKGQTALSKDGEGKFGRSMIMGPEGYVACSANENIDLQCGTIEVWCKFMSPGNDKQCHDIVGVPGSESISLRKDQYGHVTLSLSSGWRTLSIASVSGYANRWQPGVWRHFAACWDRNLLQLFVDGKLIAWATHPRMPRALGPELGIGGPNMELDDLRISNIVRYRVPVYMEE